VTATPKGPTVRVMLVEDDELMREGLRAVLSSDESIDVVEEADNGRVAIQRARRARPDVVLMDVRMPEMDGIAATGELIDAVPEAKVVILTTFEEDEYILGALRAGASGFLLKRTSPEELTAAIRTVAAGEALLSPSVTRRVIDRMAAQPVVGEVRDARLDELTPREREVLELIATGLSNREIAEALVVEETTVKTHVKRVLMKLDARDRVQAVILAYEWGLVAPGSGGRSGAAS
jgi:DNA-binding NarL/FixJ family response regulator